MKRHARPVNARRSLQSLVRIALRHWDSDRGWRAIHALQTRDSPQALALARCLSASPGWRRRCLGLHMASQLRRGRGLSGAEYAREETQQLFLAALADPHAQVLCAAVSGLGHRPHPDALPRLITLASRGDARLRWQVATALGAYKEASATEALVQLMKDPDADVRDWATFGLGSLHDADSPAIRAALWQGLEDSDADVRGEALIGLAERRDPGLIDYLVKHLGSDSRVYELDAAEMLADPRLLAPLQAIEEKLQAAERQGYWFTCLQAALGACQTGHAVS